MEKNRQWTVAFIGGGIVFMLVALVQLFMTGDYTPAILGFGAVLLFAGLIGRIFKPPATKRRQTTLITVGVIVFIVLLIIVAGLAILLLRQQSSPGPAATGLAPRPTLEPHWGGPTSSEIHCSPLPGWIA